MWSRSTLRAHGHPSRSQQKRRRARRRPHLETLEDRLLLSTVSSPETPYRGALRAIPGTIQAEDFDNGGEGVSYHDTSAGNAGRSYRDAGVDIGNTADGGHVVGWIKAGEWLNYTVDVAKAGTYYLNLRVANVGDGGTMHVDFGGVAATSSLTIPNTGGWRTWRTISTEVQLHAGRQIMQVHFDGNSTSGYVGNLDFISLVPQQIIPSIKAPAQVDEESLFSLSGSATGGQGELTYRWDLNGDGVYETAGRKITTSYPRQGRYTVGLQVSDTFGGSAASTATIIVNGVAPAVKIGGPYRANAQVPVSFSGSTTEPAEHAALTWNFGDGTTATGANPSHAFDRVGTYTVTLTATSADGLSSSATTVVDVFPSVAAGLDSTVHIGDAIHFSGTAAGSERPRYHWDFGDGSTADGGPTPTHTYINPGNYLATLTVTDPAWGFSTASSVRVKVLDAAPNLTITNPASALPGQPLTFTATATSASPALQAAGFTYKWDFGDGATITISGPNSVESHVYSTPGAYTVSVIATDQAGATSKIATSLVKVLPTRLLRVSAGRNFTIGEGVDKDFSGSATGGTPPYSYSWDFGDSTSGTGPTPTHAYADNGSYKVKLLVTDSGGQSRTASITATVTNTPPTASITAPPNGTVGAPVTFLASATDPSPTDTAAGFTYNWDFGDGGTATGAAASHTFTTAGDYTVSVTATDKDGGVSPVRSHVVHITASSDPLVLVAGTPISSGEGAAVTFSATLSGGAAPYTYYWNYGDGNDETTATLNPTHTYQDDGSFTAMVCVTDSNGQSATGAVTVSVANAAPTVTVSGQAQGNVGQPMTFIASATDASPVDRFAGLTYSWNFGDGSTVTGPDLAASHTYTRAGAYTVSVTATDKDGARSVLASTTIAIVAATVIPIDSAWIARHGPGPYLLDQDQATYKLMTDVTTSGTAFVIAGKYVTFDLNGHTVTYGNAAPITVPNGGFEADPIGATNISNWDTSGAPDSTFTIAANDVYLYGSKVLKWSVTTGVTTPQVIKSATIPIPVANRVYTASLSTSHLGMQYDGCTLKMEVVDSVTGQTMAIFNELDAIVWHGDSPTYSFFPQTTNPVYLRVTMVPDGGRVNIKVDQASLAQSMDYGILASSRWRSSLGTDVGSHAHAGEINAIVNLPSQIQSVYARVYAPTIMDSLGTGSVTQGQGAGVYSHNVVVSDTQGGVVVRGIHTYTRGMSSIPIKAVWGRPTSTADARLISGCTVDYPTSGLNIIRRDDVNSAIDVTGSSPTLVENCTITNNPATGISLGSAVDGPIQTVRGNTLHPNTIVTNAYAIAIGGSHARIINNTITTTDGGSSRGIMLDNMGATQWQDVLVQGNNVYVQERGNREYGNAISERALKMRNYGTGGFRDVTIDGNTFVAVTRDGYMKEAVGGSAYFNGGNQNVVLSNNLFKGLVLGAADPGAGYISGGFAIDKCEPGQDVRFVGNTFESNGSGLILGTGNVDRADAPTADLDFKDSVFRRSSEGVPRNFVSYQFGCGPETINNVSIINPSYQNGATDAITWMGTGQKLVHFGWGLTLVVKDSANKPISGATVQLRDSSGKVLYLGNTNAQGVRGFDVRTLYYSGAADPPPTSEGPSTLIVSASGYPDHAEPISLTAKRTKTIQMNR